jgi:hypothetical protein
MQFLEAVLLHLPDVDQGVPQAARIAFHSIFTITPRERQGQRRNALRRHDEITDPGLAVDR